ncbi:MAG TPA: GDSL-type esterase/lipase family protein [Acidimicrobiales bacterium]|nr:GDSL-type esterase/lipase family protein [Acidimicrobiales bacterium]
MTADSTATTDTTTTVSSTSSSTSSPITQTTSSTNTSTTSNNAVPVRVIGHCTVLEIGDSLGNDLGWGLARELAPKPGLKLVQRDKSASGLVASWFYNWPEHLKTMLARYHPNLVVVCVGGDDEQGLEVNGHAYGFDSPPWLSRYSALIRQIDAMITRSGSYVLWVGLPVMAPTSYRVGVATLNSLYRSVGVTVPGVTYLPSWDLFANAQGQYQSVGVVNHVRTVLRSSDGIHLSYVGENVFATYVANEIAAIYHVRLAPRQPALITN